MKRSLFLLLILTFIFAGCKEEYEIPITSGEPLPYVETAEPSADEEMQLAEKSERIGIPGLINVAEADGSPDGWVKKITFTNGTVSVSGADATVTISGVSPGSGSVTTLEEGDSQVGDADIVTLDFQLGFALVESPDTEVNISLDVTPSAGNATLVVEQDALQVLYDTTDFGESASGLTLGASPTIATSLAIGSDPADSGAIRLDNAAAILFEASPTGTDVSALTVTSGEVVQIGASGASGVTLTPAVTASAGITIADAQSLTFDEAAADPNDADVVLSAADGVLTIAAANGANNENMTIDFDASSNVVTINSGTSATFTITPALSVTGGVTAALTGNATTSTTATNVVITDNENTAENNAVAFVANADLDGSTSIGLESDGDFTYTPSTGTVTATVFSGALSGNATTSTTATTATNVVITDNESTNENNVVAFVADADADGSTSIGLESDGNFYYNPSTGTVTATAFAGDLTGAVTGNASTSTTATNVVITDNESTAETNAIAFVANADLDGNTSIGLESDGDLTYTPSTGSLSAPIVVATTQIELSHASENTLTASSGVLSIEGAALGKVAGQAWTGTHDFGGADDLEMPNGSSITIDTTGQFGLDTDGNGGQFSTATMVVSTNGATLGYIIPVAALPGDAEDNMILKFDAATDTIGWEADASAGTTAMDDIADPDAATTIAFDDTETITLSTAQDTAGSFLLIDNTTADVGNDVYLIEGQYTDDDDANALYLKFSDNNGAEVVFTVGNQGLLSIGEDPGDTGTAINLINASSIAWEDATEITLTHVDNTGLATNGSFDITGAGGLVLSNDETITNAADGIVVINGSLTIGAGAAADYVFKVDADNADGTITWDETPGEFDISAGINVTGASTIGDGGAANYLAISATGAVTFAGTAAITLPTSTNFADTAFTDMSNGGTYTNFGAAGDDTIDELFAAIDTAIGGLGGDITAVGPGFASGAAFTDGVVSTGTTLFVWEGTTDDTVELIIAGPADPVTADSTLTLPQETGTFVLGPAGLGTDNILIKTDGTGNLTQATGITVDDSNNVGSVGTLGLAGDVTMTSTSPDILFVDSTTSGEAKIAISDGAGPDGVMDLQVDVAGSLTTYIQLDGLNGVVDVTPSLVMAANPQIYDGDSHYLTIDSADLTAAATIVLGSDTNNLTIANGTAAIDIAAAATLDIDKSFSVGGQEIILTGAGQANIVVFNEAFTIGDGNSGTLTFSAASKTLTVADNTSLNQDLLTTSAPTFATVDTGQGANELYDMDQNVLTTSSPTFVALTLSDAITLSDGATIDQSANNMVEITENSDYVRFNFGGTDVDIVWNDGVLNLRNNEDSVNAIVEIEGKDAGERGELRVLSDGGDKNIALYHNDTNSVVASSSGNLILSADGDTDDYIMIDTTTNVPSISPDSADGGTLGSAAIEWSDLYLAASGVIYGENDQSNTITSSATGWTFNQAITAVDATFTGTTTVSTLTQAATATPTWLASDSSTSADGTFDIKVDAATAKYAGLLRFYVDEGDGAGADGAEDVLFMTINGNGATSTASGTIEFERIGNFEMGLSSSNGTSSAGFIDLYQNESTGSNYVKVIAPTLSASYTLTLPVDDGNANEILKTDGSGNLSWTTAGTATAWDDLVQPDADETLNMAGYTTQWTWTETAADMFTIFATGAFGDYSVLRVEQKTGNPTDGDLLSLVTADNENDVDQLVLANGTDDYVTHRIVEAGTYTIDVTSDGTAAVSIPDPLSTGSTLTVGTDLTITGGDITVDGTEEVITIADVASATNNISISNAANGSSPSITGIGSSDANVGIIIDAKAAGEIAIGSADAKFSVASDAIDISNTGVITNAGAITSTGVITGTGFTIGSAAITETELEILDGATIGVVAGDISGVDSIDGTGAVDIDIGSADITDVTILTDGGTDSLTIGSGADLDYGITISSDTNTFTLNWDEDNAELELTSVGDEDLVIDLDTATDNEVGISSSTGVTQLNFGSLNLVTTGYVLGALRRVDVDSGDADDSYTIAAADGYGIYITNKGDDDLLTVVLPDVVDGMTVCVALYAAQDINIDPNGSERILVDTDTNGDYVSSDATAGSFYCLVGVSATEWMPMGSNGTWTEE